MEAQRKQLTHRLSISRELYIRLYSEWKKDHDDEGYDFPYIEDWTKYRHKATFQFNHNHDHEIAGWMNFQDANDLVIFRLSRE